MNLSSELITACSSVLNFSWFKISLGEYLIAHILIKSKIQSAVEGDLDCLKGSNDLRMLLQI